MSILFLKTPSIGSFVRPSGYTFPVGLNNTGNAADGPTSVDYLVVAGGGGATADGGGGGGGAGGFVEGTLSISNGLTYSITIGSGGPGNSQGSNSAFGSIVSIGGGSTNAIACNIAME